MYVDQLRSRDNMMPRCLWAETKLNLQFWNSQQGLQDFFVPKKHSFSFWGIEF